MKKTGKRLLSALLIVCMVASLATAAFATTTSDIEGHWARAAMQEFIDKGWLSGYGDGAYGPNDSMTRAQYAALINRVAGLTEESDAISDYTDVSATAWYRSDLAKALAAGYMNGSTTTTMSPNSTISREQAVTMVARLLGLTATDEQVAALEKFSDANQIHEYAKNAFAAMVAAGYVNGVTDTTLAPQDTLNRASGVTLLRKSSEALSALTPTTGTLKDGVYTGTGAGFGGTLTLQMTVSGGKITAIEILDNSETAAYLNQAKSIIDKVIKNQTTDGVDAVSGATKSSNAILTAIDACISQAKGGDDTSSTGSTGGGGGGAGNSTPTEGEEFARLADGTYEGSAAGYSGTTKVRVTVESGKITAVEVLSHGDTDSYFNSAISVINKVVEKQSTDVDTVSGATYSSYGILNAINNALKDAESNDSVTIEVATWAEFTKALAAAQDGDTVKLTDNITDAGQVDAVSSATATVNKSITIDGNNKTISAYTGGKVTKNTTDREGNITATEQVDATFCFDVTGAQGIVIKDLIIDGASFSEKLGGAMYVETGAEVALNNVTFKNTKSGNAGDGNGGAAIYAEPHKGSSPTVTATNCTFTNCMVNDGTTGRGGAVYGYNANITLTDCTFTDNKAAFGKAVAAAGTSTLTVTGCTFSDTSRSNDAFIYIFDGYTAYKKSIVADSNVAYDISGNTNGTAVIGRVLGTYNDVTYSGSGNAIFLPGDDLSFDISTTEGRARTGDSTKNETEYVTLWMNIPYDDFYKAELAGNTVNVDAVTSATKAKTRTGGMMSGGSYHVNADGSDITGVTFPVVMSSTDFAKFNSDTNYTGNGKGQVVTDESTVSITVTNKGSTTTTPYTGKDALFESASYSYYKVEDSSSFPTYYKVASYNDSTLTFGETQGVATTLTGVTGTFMTSTTYGDYQLNLVGISAFDISSDQVNGVVIHTKEGSDYGLRHVENIWRGTQLAWSTGFVTTTHGCTLSYSHYASMMGKTITGVTYYTSKGVFEIALDEIYVPVKFANTFSVAEADVTAGTAAVTMTGFPDDFTNKTYAITDAKGNAAEGLSCNGTAVTWTTAKPGTYTLTVSDSDGKYATYSTTFTLFTSTNPVEYNAATLSLTGNADDLADYLSAITSVKVGDQTYSASGRDAVTVINESGFIDLNAKSGQNYVFSSLTAGTTYNIEVTATGYSNKLTFTVTSPETIYAYTSLTYAEYWANENVYLSGDDMTASNSTTADRTYSQGGSTYSEYDKGAFDAVSRATTNHGLHRGSFQQSVTIKTNTDKTYSPLYWIDGNNFVDATDGKTYDKTKIGMTSYEITGIKYVPVAVPAANYHDFCAAYTVTQNGETLAGGYSEQNLKSYQTVACVTANTNGLKTATLNDGSWSFGARQTGTDSGILGQDQNAAANVTANVNSNSQFGDFIRVDITGDGYGELGDMMQTVVWKYYGDDSTCTTALATYGTKFAADNWMHKSMGIQLGLTESLRCQLPEGTYGTGYWTVTVYALGYADYTVRIQVTADDIHGSLTLMTEAQKTQLTDLKEQAAALLTDYNADTASDALKTLKEHYDEAVALLENVSATSAEAEELLSELPTLIAAVQSA